MFILSGANLT